MVTGASCGSLSNPHAGADKHACGTGCYNPRTAWVIDMIACVFPDKFSCSTYEGSATSDHPGSAADCTPNAISAPQPFLACLRVVVQ